MADHEVDDPRLRRRQHVANRAHDDRLDRAASVHGLLQHLCEVLEHDDDAGAGVPELVGELAGRVERIGVDHHRSRANRPEERHRVLQQVGNHDRHPVALLDARLMLKPGRETSAHDVEVAETEARPHVRERRPVAVAVDRVFDHRPHRREGVSGRCREGLPQGSSPARLASYPAVLVGICRAL